MNVGVKICGLMLPDDVDAAVEAGVDAVGVVMAASWRRVVPNTARTLLQRVPREVTRVVVVRAPDAETIEALRTLPLDVIQCDAADVPALAPLKKPLLPVFYDHEELLVRIELAKAGQGPIWKNAFVVDGPRGGGRGERADFDRAKQVAHRGGMVLAGGLDPEIIGVVVRHVRPAGVDVSTGVESAQGKKDKGKMKAFVQAVRAEQRRSAE